MGSLRASNTTTRLSINPFRCAVYSATTTAAGIVGCDRCYAGSYSTSDQVVPSIEPDAKNNVFYVPQVISTPSPTTSCLYTAASNLASLCDVVVRVERSSKRQRHLPQGKQVDAICCPAAGCQPLPRI
ncbi:Aste57867_8264 [Aphanomyces stellatus]|uniref:Aste57867_8264 protein n=1 Tax=Aphanomyces stellatus TaxID=120398 RepID=A0A485KJS6_9STRA|nr:hypothetical protein As57867_008233 [Aphanomyces stellatus]VFT85151.1 Aste57867_8264 [Aphanomyces stellatus]